MKALIFMPAHNVANVIAKTIEGVRSVCQDDILVVDDASTDETGAIARKMGAEVVRHEKNRGYGGTQKTGYQEAIRRGYDLVVMVHGDNQYDPTLANQFVSKIRDEKYDVVTGTRMILGDALRQGMPIWKYIPNRFLTYLENFVFGTKLTDYHNGYRAFTTAFLKQVPIDMLSEKFDFDTDIIIQAAIRKAKIAEIPHPTRYQGENSQMSFTKGVHYGLSILRTVLLYLLHKSRICEQKLFAEKKNHA
ncbi:MAG: glycosyltransferase family 2 protein [Candidatus Omnitrophica bacterium]|nr:glycosyltransferase family 2 protein [Candidatus Omnitrophota bacterium]